MARASAEPARADAVVGAVVRASFVASDRTYGPGASGTMSWRPATPAAYQSPVNFERQAQVA